eukprot:TRINITY_DN5814_c0_g1_i1.p1 TRINITY_DN5814_c0_g1~~TRINITY_DN5814_c0_g1_i1.p1  ORF type:complete len:239 (+),score=29.15 TRINITY_DN5814_c0_g1_i1:24-719(+)
MDTNCNNLERTFKGYCLFGSSGGKWELDGARFAKWCRESGLTGIGKCGQVGIDVVFSKCRSETGTRKVDYITLRGKVIPMLSKELKITQERVVEQLSSIPGPRDNSTHGNKRRKHVRPRYVDLPAAFPPSPMFPYQPSPRSVPQPISEYAAPLTSGYPPHVGYDIEFGDYDDYHQNNDNERYQQDQEPVPRLSPLSTRSNELLHSTEYLLLQEAEMYRRLLSHRDALYEDD